MVRNNKSWVRAALALLALVLVGCPTPTGGGGSGSSGGSDPTTFSVEYRPNGADSGTVPVDPNEYEPGVAAIVLGNTGNLAQVTGLIFAGWNTAADGTGVAYQPGDEIFVVGPWVLYAQWAQPLQVIYLASGADAGTAPVDSNTYLEGDTFTVLGNTGSLSRTGFLFVGWNTFGDGTGITYDVGSDYTMSAFDLVLYPLWANDVAFPKTVTYDGNGASSGTIPVDANTYETDQSATVLGNTGNLERTGFDFSGWNTRPDGLGSSYAPGDNLLIQFFDVTLYAVWTLRPVFTVSYDPNNADSGVVPAPPIQYEQGDTVTVLDSFTLVRNGYDFDGWNTAPNGTGTAYAPGDTFVAESDTTLHAQWDLIGGRLDTTFTAPTINDSVFAITVQDSDDKVLIGGSFTTVGGASRNYIARLNANGTLDTSFHFNGETGPNGNVADIVVDSNDKIVILGGFTEVNGVTRVGVARLNSDGSLDTTFTPPGMSLFAAGNGNSIAVDTSDRVLVGGFRSVVRLGTDGTVDATFSVSTSNPDFVNAIVPLSDGTVVIAGDFNQVDGWNSTSAVQIRADGSRGYQVSGLGTETSTITADSADRLLVMASNRRLQRNTTTGAIDTTFERARFDAGLNRIVVQPDGKVVVTGRFFRNVSPQGTLAQIPRVSIARFETDGSLDMLFDPGSGPSGLVLDVDVQSDNGIIIGGNITQYRGVAVSRVIRLVP